MPRLTRLVIVLALGALCGAITACGGGSVDDDEELKALPVTPAASTRI